MRQLALVTVLAIACGLACSSPITNASSASSLRLVYHKGDVYKYSYHATAAEIINAAPITFEITALHTYTVWAVDSGGTADLSLAVTNLIINAITGNVTNAISSPRNPSLEVKAARDGRILRFSGENQAPETLWTVLPDRSVKPGDTWSKDYDSTTDGSGATHLRTKSTYLRVESFRGRSTSVVKTTADATSDITGSPLPPNAIGGAKSTSLKGTATLEITSWIDLETHRLLKTHSTSTSESITTIEPAGSTLNGTSGPITITAVITVDLVPA